MAGPLKNAGGPATVAPPKPRRVCMSGAPHSFHLNTATSLTVIILQNTFPAYTRITQFEYHCISFAFSFDDLTNFSYNID